MTARIQLATERDVARLARRLGVDPGQLEGAAVAPEVRRAAAASMLLPLTASEDELTRAVLELAGLLEWRSAHFRAARTTRGGWRTAVAGDGVGFPDLVLLRGERIIAAELKSGNNRPSPAQRAWLRAFGAVGAECHVWYPHDFAEIKTILGAYGNG